MSMESAVVLNENAKEYWEGYTKKNAGGVEEGTSQDEYLCVPVLVQEFCLSVEKTLM